MAIKRDAGGGEGACIMDCKRGLWHISEDDVVHLLCIGDIERAAKRRDNSRTLCADRQLAAGRYIRLRQAACIAYISHSAITHTDLRQTG